MKKKYSQISNLHFAFLSIITFVVFFTGCKENTILPKDLVPPIDNISTFIDTNQLIIANNIYQDSLLTGGVGVSSRISNVSTFYAALGTLTNDPNFGKTVASFHTEAIPANTLFTFKGTNQQIDSIVLSIPYITSYGDTITANAQTFNVYRSTQFFSRDSAQYEFTKDVYDPSSLLGSQTVNFNTFRTDSPTVGTIKVIPQLRFKLVSWFVDSLLKQIFLGANGAMSTFANYTNWWNGFYVTPADTNTGKTLGYFNTYGTRLNIYYRYTNTNSTQDTTVDIFGFDPNNSNRFNHITRNFSGSLCSNYLNTNNPNGDSILFIQTQPGIVAELKFPNLVTATSENRIINKAELLFNSLVPTSMMTDSLNAGLMPRMYVLRVDGNGVDKIPTDYGTFGANFVDGKRYTATFLGMTFIQYKFLLTQSFQTAISQKDTTFKLKIMGLNPNSTGYPAAYESVLRGSSILVTNMTPRLNLIYTKIK